MNEEIIKKGTRKRSMKTVKNYEDKMRWNYYISDGMKIL